MTDLTPHQHDPRAHRSMGKHRHFSDIAPRLIACAAAAVFLGIGGVLPAQEALQKTLDAEAAAQFARYTAEREDYNFRAGDFRLWVTPSLGLDWSDNVHLSDQDKKSDFILRPVLNLRASHPITRRNVLTLDVGVGYSHYFSESELSRWYLRSGSHLSFDIFFGDFWLNLHDRFSYTQDATLEPAVAGTGQYAIFENTIGLSGTWDLNDLVLTLGYDHINAISLDDEYEQRTRSSEMLFSRAGFRAHPKLTTGVEGSAVFTTYDDPILNDNRGYSAGLYADYRPGNYLTLTPRAGYSYYDFDQTSLYVQAEDLDTWYADLTFTHQPTEVVSYSISAGHELRTGVQSDAIESTYIRSSASWAIFRNFSLTTGLSYEHGEEQGGNLRDPDAASTEEFDYFGGGVSLGYTRWKHLTFALNYRFTLRASNIDYRDYTQNLVGLTVTYRP